MKSTEELVLRWLVTTRRTSFTAQEIQTDCKTSLDSNSLYRSPVTIWRACQRLKERGYLGTVREENCSGDGQRWLRFHFTPELAAKGLQRLMGSHSLFGPARITHGRPRA